MFMLLVIALVVVTLVYPHIYAIVPWIVLIIIYQTGKQNIINRKERKIFNKLEIVLNKPINV